MEAGYLISTTCTHHVHLMFLFHRLDIITCTLEEHCNIPYAAKAKAQRFTRRKSNLVKKADQLARLCHADLALIIRKNGRYYTYRSTDYERWPPPIIEIVRRKPMHQIWANSSLESILPFACQPVAQRFWQVYASKPAKAGGKVFLNRTSNLACLESSEERL